MIGAAPARHLVPERLDGLPHDAPEALASRRDLRRINAMMRSRAVLRRLLAEVAPRPPRRLAELGCGDGHLSVALARDLAPDWPGATLTLVDVQPVVPGDVREAIEALGWRVEVVTADVFDWLATAPAQDAVFANLFLHHFEGAALGRLVDGIARVSTALAAAEPRRSALSLAAARSVGLIGANAVTRHDAPASVRAGFRFGDLADHWPGTVHQDRAFGPFTHGFAATGGRHGA